MTRPLLQPLSSLLYKQLCLAVLAAIIGQKLAATSSSQFLPVFHYLKLAQCRAWKSKSPGKQAQTNLTVLNLSPSSRFSYLSFPSVPISPPVFPDFTLWYKAAAPSFGSNVVSTSRPARRVHFQCSLTRKVLQSLSSRDTFAPQIHLFKPKPTSDFLQTFPQLPKGSSNPPSPEVLTALVTTSLYRMYPNPATVYSTLVKK